jgi:hypothetical protein
MSYVWGDRYPNSLRAFYKQSGIIIESNNLYGTRLTGSLRYNFQAD